MKLLVYCDSIFNIILALTRVLLFTTVVSHIDRFIVLNSYQPTKQRIHNSLYHRNPFKFL